MGLIPSDIVDAYKDQPSSGGGKKTKVREAAELLRSKGFDIDDDTIDDFDLVTGLESGRSHYSGKSVKRGVPTANGEQAIGYSQVMPETARPYQAKGLDPFKEIDNIAIGLAEYKNGDAGDPIARRLAYVGGPKGKALRHYRKTGEVPDWKLYSYLPDNNETYKSYVERSGGFKSRKRPEVSTFNTFDDVLAAYKGGNEPQAAPASLDDVIGLYTNPQQQAPMVSASGKPFMSPPPQSASSVRPQPATSAGGQSNVQPSLYPDIARVPTPSEKPKEPGIDELAAIGEAAKEGYNYTESLEEAAKENARLLKQGGVPAPPQQSIAQQPERPVTEAGFVADVDPVNVEPGRDKNEGVFRQAVRQLGPKLNNRPLNKLEEEALVDLQRKTKGGFAFEDNDPSKPTAVEDATRYTIDAENATMFKNYLDENRDEFTRIRQENLKEFLAAGGTLDEAARQKFVELGFAPEELDQLSGFDPVNNVYAPNEFTQAVEDRKAEYKRLVALYAQAPDEDTRMNAITYARRAMGWIDPGQAAKEVQDYYALKAEKAAELGQVTVTDPFAGTTGRSMAMAGGLEQRSPDQQARELQSYLTAIIGKYGTASNRLEVKRQEDLAETARQNRVAQMSWPEYIAHSALGGSLNMTKSAVSVALSGTLRGIGLAAKEIDDALYGAANNPRKKVSDYWTYQAGNSIDGFMDYVMPTNKDMQKEFFAGKLPQGFGSTLGMALGGLSKTPRLAIAVLSALQMGGDEYKTAIDAGATEEEAQLAGMLNAPLGVTEIFGIGQAITRLNKGTGGTVWKKMFREAFNAGRREVPEELLQEGTQTTASNIIGRLTYDPDRKADKDLYDNLLVAGISAPLAASGVTILNTARNRHAIIQLIKQEQANGVIIKSYGDGELYVFDQKVPVTPELAPMVERYNLSRNGIMEVQAQIEQIQKAGSYAKTPEETAPFLQKIWDLKKELNALTARQVQISKDIADRSGVGVPEGTVGDSLIPEPSRSTGPEPSVDTFTTPPQNMTGSTTDSGPQVVKIDAHQNFIKYYDDPEWEIFIGPDGQYATNDPEFVRAQRIVDDLLTRTQKATSQGENWAETELGEKFSSAVATRDNVQNRLIGEVAEPVERPIEPQTPPVTEVVRAEPDPSTTEGRFAAYKATNARPRTRISQIDAAPPKTEPAKPLTALQKFEERKLGRLGYKDEDRAALTNEQRKQILRDRTLRRDFFRKTPKVIPPVTLDKPVLVEFGTRGTYRKLRNSHNIARLRKAGYTFKNLNKKAVTVTAAPEGTESGSVAGNFENVIYNIDAERTAQRKPSARAGKPFFQKKGVRTLTESVRAAGGIRPDSDAKRRGKKGDLERFEGIPGIVNQNAELNAEEMARMMWESGYLRDVWGNTIDDLNADEFLQILESDALGIARASSTLDESEGSFEDEIVLGERDRTRQAMLEDLLGSMSEEEIDRVEKIADFLSDDAVWPVFEDLEFTGELKDENRDKAVKRGVQYGVDKNVTNWFIDTLKEFVARRPEIGGAAEEVSTSESQRPDTRSESRETASAAEDSLYADEFDHADIEDTDVEDDAPGSPRQVTSRSDQFDAALSELRAESEPEPAPASEATGFDAIADLMGFAKTAEAYVDDDGTLIGEDGQPLFAAALSAEQRKTYDQLREHFETEYAKLADAGDAAAQTKAFIQKLNDRFTLDQIEKLKPFVVAFLEEQDDLGGSDTEVVENVATDAAHDAATSPENDLPEPTQAQKEAGNYRKGHISVNGLDISVENPVGSVRSGTNRNGKKWSVRLKSHYGYVKRSTGADEENIDVFVKDGTPADFAGDVYVIDQVTPDTGRFDEHKVMLGFASEQEAREAYAENYAKGWKGLKSITAMPFDEFTVWVRDGVQDKPVAPKTTSAERFEAKKNSARATDPDAAARPKVVEKSAGRIKRSVAPDISEIGEGNAPIAERGPDRAVSDIEHLAHLAITETFADHGLSGFDIPSQRRMLAGMLAALHEPQIRKAIVGLDMVDVVNHLVTLKSSTDILLHDDNVLSTGFTVNSDGSISLGRDTADTLVRMTARAAAKLSESPSSGNDERKAAKLTVKSNSAENRLTHNRTEIDTGFIATDASVTPLEDGSAAAAINKSHNDIIAQSGAEPKTISPLDTPEKQAAHYKNYLAAEREESLISDDRPRLTSAERFEMLKRADAIKVKREKTAAMSDEEIADLARRDKEYQATLPIPKPESAKESRPQGAVGKPGPTKAEVKENIAKLAENADPETVEEEGVERWQQTLETLIIKDYEHIPKELERALRSRFDSGRGLFRETKGEAPQNGSMVGPGAALQDISLPTAHGGGRVASDHAGGRDVSGWDRPPSPESEPELAKLFDLSHREPQTYLRHLDSILRQVSDGYANEEGSTVSRMEGRLSALLSQAEESGKVRKAILQATRASEGGVKVQEDSSADLGPGDMIEFELFDMKPRGAILEEHSPTIWNVQTRERERLVPKSKVLRKVDSLTEPEPEKFDTGLQTDLFGNAVAPPKPAKAAPEPKIEAPTLFDKGGLDEEGLFAQGGPAPIEPTRGSDAEKEKQLADLRSKGEKAAIADAEKAWGAKNATVIAGLSKSDDADLANAAKSMLKASKFVAEQNYLQSNKDAAIEALEGYSRVRQRGVPVDQEISQGRIDGTEYSNEAERYLRALEDGSFTVEMLAGGSPAAESISVPITDFGEKIGGARKDTAESGYTMSGKKKTADEKRPAWMKGFEIGETEEGKFRPMLTDGASRGARRIFWESKDEYDSKDEALEVIKAFVVAQKFRVYGTDEKQFAIYRLVGDKGKSHVIKGGFATREEGMRYMATHLDELVAYKPKFPERPHIENLQRTGKQYRSDNVTTKQFLEEFGFTGGEFGNWVPQDERQRILNMAFDGLHDLADILAIPPKALSLDGQLSIAFGSRGHGLTGAAAHYERDRAVFNLTRLHGAGAVAHEWFHALDNYFGAQNRGLTLEKDERGKVKAATERDSDFLSHAENYHGIKKLARQEIRDAFKALITTIYKQEKIVEVSVERYQKLVAQGEKDLEGAIRRLRQYIENEYPYARKKAPASPEQMKAFDALIERVRNGDLGEEVRIPTKSRYSLEVRTSQVYHDLNELVMAVRGRSELKLVNERSDGGMIKRLEHDARKVREGRAQLEKYTENNKEERLTPTQFAYDAKDIDRMRTSAYWSTEHEMAARAFEAYIEDQLKKRGDLSQYLVHSTENSIYKILFDLNPYPEGIERERINEAFEKFFDVVESEETDQGVRLYSRITSSGPNVSDLGFYSGVEQDILDKMPEKASAEQIRGILKDAKQEELEWLDIDSFLKQKGDFTKQEVLDFIRENNVDLQEVVHAETGEPHSWAVATVGGDTKYSPYTLPGGENYRELLLTLPPKGLPSNLRIVREGLYRTPNNEHITIGGNNWTAAAIDENGIIRALTAANDIEAGLRRSLDGADGNYKSPHWSEPNVLAHVRFDERDGGKTLHISEIQSDWHQEGRKKGYSADLTPEEQELRELQRYFDSGVGLGDDAKRARRSALIAAGVASSMARKLDAVPDAPFKKSWHELVFKRMLRYAAENGYDRITWDTGETQADRYDLSKHVDSVHYSAEQGRLWAIKDNETPIDEMGVKPEDLEKYVGKEVAQKLLDAPIDEHSHDRQTVEGNNLKVGGEGMKGFYDKILPSFANKYTKKWGGRVQNAELPIKDPERNLKAFEVLSEDDTPFSSGSNRIDAEDSLRRAREMYPQVEWRIQDNRKLLNAPVHSLAITPDMKLSIARGQKLFARRSAEAANLLTDVLPKVETHVLLAGIKSQMIGDDLELTPHAAETLRRLEGEIEYQNFSRRRTKEGADAETIEREFDEQYPSHYFTALTNDANSFRILAQVGRSLIADFEAAGYTDEDLAGYNELLANLETLAAAAEDFGVAYVFDEDLPEEHFHQEDLRGGRTDQDALTELAETELWQNPGMLFTAEYPELSPADKASEIAAKLATDQGEKYGWDKRPNFAEEKEIFLKTWADGVVRRNRDWIESNGVDAFVDRFERIAFYAKIEKSDSSGSDSGKGSKSSRKRGTRKRPTGRSREANAGRGEKPNDNRSAATRSLEQERREAVALGVDVANVRIKNRKFAETLRDNGRDDVADVPYIPGADIDRIREAKDIMRESVIAADDNSFATGDYDYALEQFFDPDLHPRTRTVLGIALIDHLGSAGDLELMNQVAGRVIEHVGEAAQAVQAASIACKYDFARGVMLAKRALESHGKQLTQEHIDELKKATSKLAATQREKALIAKMLEDAETVIAEQQEEIEEIRTALAEAVEGMGLGDAERAKLEAALEESIAENAEKDGMIENLKRQLARWRKKSLHPTATTAGGGASKTYRDLAAEMPAIKAALAEAFPGKSLKAAIAGENAPLRSAITDHEDFDDEKREQVVKYFAYRIFEGDSYKEVLDAIADLTDGILNPDEIRAIHSDAEAMTHGEKSEAGDEAKAKRASRREHERFAKAFRKDAGLDETEPAKRAKKTVSRAAGAEKFNKLDRKMLELAGDDDQLGVAAILYRLSKSASDWYDSIARAYPELDATQQNDLFVRARKHRDKAVEALKAELAEKRGLIEDAGRDYEQFKKESLIAASYARRHKATLDRLFKRLSKSQAEQNIDLALDILSTPKTMMSTGEVSYIGRQGFLPLVLFTGGRLKDGKLVDGAVKSLLGIVKGMSSDVSRAIYEETLRNHRHFDRAQYSGTIFSQIGDFNTVEEHFAGRAFQKAAESGIPGLSQFGKAQLRFEHAYTLPGDAQRLFISSILFDLIDDQNLAEYDRLKADKMAAKIANAFTGKSNLEFFKRNNTITKLINLLGFAPSYTGSRFEASFYLSPLGLLKAPKGLRMMLLRKQVRFHTVMFALAMAALFTLDAEGDDDERSRWDILDPASKSFLKGRIRGTDQKFDLTANMSEPMRLFFYNAVGSGYYAVRGEWNKLSDIWRQERERYLYTDSGQALRYFRGKLSPTASFALDTLTGKDYIGRDVKTASDIAWAAAERFIPLTYKQTFDALTMDSATELMRPGLNEQKAQQWRNIKNGDLSVTSALTVFMSSALGANFQDYAEVEKSRAEMKAWELYEGFSSKKTTPEQREINAGLRKIYRYREELARRGQNTELLDRRTNEIVRRYGITDEAQKAIKAQATGSRFAFVTKRMAPEQIEMLIDEYATAKEKPELQSILAAKQAAAAKKDEPPKPLIERVANADTADLAKLYKRESSELTSDQRFEIRKKLKQKASDSYLKNRMSPETYDIVKDVLGDEIKFPRPRPKVKVERPIVGLDSLKESP